MQPELAIAQTHMVKMCAEMRAKGLKVKCEVPSASRQSGAIPVSRWSDAPQPRAPQERARQGRDVLGSLLRLAKCTGRRGGSLEDRAERLRQGRCGDEVARLGRAAFPVALEYNFTPTDPDVTLYVADPVRNTVMSAQGMVAITVCRHSHESTRIHLQVDAYIGEVHVGRKIYRDTYRSSRRDNHRGAKMVEVEIDYSRRSLDFDDR